MSAAAGTGTMVWLERLSRTANAEALRRDLARRHAALDDPRDLVILGAAGEGRRLAELCRRHGIRIAAIADDNPAMQGSEIAGVAVRRVDELGACDRTVPVVIASHRTLLAARRLGGMGFAHVVPFALLQLLRPDRFAPHMFYDGWLGDLFENRARYGELADGLADDFSRTVLDAVLGYRMSCDPTVLEPIVEWDLYAPANLFAYGEDEVYIDGGSYDGDSVRLFIDRVRGRYERILAFEPDPGTHARLATNFRGETRVEALQKGLYSRTTTLRFDGEGTRASTLTTGSDGVEVPVTSIDDVLGPGRVSFIKMNIEGAEQDALRGGASAIARWSPRLAISAYHRPADLWQIPALVRALNPCYRLYLRQHDGGVIETVLYALPQGTS